MRLLITAGPTREYIDPVRYLSNPSTGLMGYEIARAAKSLGHRVTLITGPSNLLPPKGISVKRITSAQEMYRAVNRYFPQCDAVIMTAAVSDYQPVRYYPGKIKKQNRAITLKLIPTPDILKSLGKKKGHRVLVGFALETDNLRRNVMKKLSDKNLDYAVANRPDSFGSNRITAEIWSRQGLIKRFTKTTKRKLGEFIIRLLNK
jgi:phosphopantothenoylcysteine decarboxylase/phosphopantothenate--cysteine ligase